MATVTHGGAIITPAFGAATMSAVVQPDDPMDLVGLCYSGSYYPATLDCYTLDHVDHVADLLPKGPLWRGKEIEGTAIRSWITGYAAIELSRIEKRADAYLRESIPCTAVETIEEWEALAGLPRDCDPPLPAAIEDRQINVCTALARTAAITEGDFLAIAQSLGYTSMTVTHYDHFRASKNCAGDPVCNNHAAYTVDIEFAPTGPNDAQMTCIMQEALPPFMLGLNVTFVP